MNLALWILTGLLAAVFTGAGLTKLLKPRAELKEQMPWVTDMTDGQVKGIGAVEVLGAIGLIVPAAVDIAPVLVPMAATGLALTMVGAVATHVRRRDPIAVAAAPAVLGVLALLVAVGRFGPWAF